MLNEYLGHNADVPGCFIDFVLFQYGMQGVFPIPVYYIYIYGLGLYLKNIF